MVKLKIFPKDSSKASRSLSTCVARVCSTGASVFVFEQRVLINNAARHPVVRRRPVVPCPDLLRIESLQCGRGPDLP